MNFVTLLEKIDYFMWDGFLIYLLMGVGLFLTFKLKFMQIKYLPLSLKWAFFRKDDTAKGDISQFQSLMTAIAATVGIGSIAGMATAIIGGGFGAIFWMWAMALIGMVTKFSEAILAVKYRVVDKNGHMCGGPMYYIEKGLNLKWLSFLFSLFGMLAAFAGGNLIQAQSVADAVHYMGNGSIPHVVIGIFLVFFVAIVILGGIENLGRVNAILVPVMKLFYLCGGITILIIKFQYIPQGIYMIFASAFNIKAAVGGLVGIGVMNAVQMGIARGVSSNEAGLGSAPIAAAAAKTDVPGRQALISMSGVFLSSFVVCTVTALVLAVTGVVGQTGADGALLNGAPLVMKAFSSVIPGGKFIVALSLVFFGFSTITGWSYYGEKCCEYIFGERSILPYRFVFIGVTFIGTLLSINIVWPLADIFNGLMAFPNLIGLFLLANVITAESTGFFFLLKKEKSKGI
ncbi:MAG: sodium:alanine symporter family protein [Chlamydiae bacterium]|nr:sodium:alanine symporter family protein [Chlamydiota bacterium]